MDGLSAQKASIFVWLILEIVRGPRLLEKLLPVTFDCKAIREISVFPLTSADCRSMEVDLKKKKAIRFGGCLNKNYLFLA